ALDGGDEGEANAGIAAGGLDEDSFSGMDFAGAFGFLDHADANAVFYAGTGIEAFELGGDLGLGAGSDLIQVDERSAADQFGDVVGNLHEAILNPGKICAIKSTRILEILKEKAPYLPEEAVGG